MKTLFLIPAREGSKRLPGKNVELLNGKPLIGYTIEAAIKASSNNDIVCVSTDSDDIAEVAQRFGNVIHFKRPKHLATDISSSQDVVDHAITCFREKGINFDQIILLQPTSPLRTSEDISNCLNLFSQNNCELLLSVFKLKQGFNNLIFREKKIKNILEDCCFSRVEIPDDEYYQLNGAIYVFKSKIDLNSSRICKYEMPALRSVDIDLKSDWIMAENLIGSREEI